MGRRFAAKRLAEGNQTNGTHQVGDGRAFQTYEVVFASASS